MREPSFLIVAAVTQSLRKVLPSDN